MCVCYIRRNQYRAYLIEVRSIYFFFSLRAHINVNQFIQVIAWD